MNIFFLLRDTQQKTSVSLRILSKNVKIDEKLWYKQEDDLFSQNAEICFSYKTTFRETMQDGTKKNIVGGGGSETHFKMIYLIKFSEYEKRLKDLHTLA